MTLAQIGAILIEIKAAIAGAPTLAQENAELKMKLASAASEVEELNTALSQKQAEIAAKESEVLAAKADAAKAQAEAKAANDAKAAAETALSDLKANPSQQALQIVAAAGVSPENRPAAAPAAEASGTKLKGLARTVAAFKAKAEK